MIYNLIGKEQFRTAIRKYLKAY